MMPTSRRALPVSPQALTITPSRPASPTSSDADSEGLDDGTYSPCPFTGEECPDLCGGPKSSCRSWTPPASPFYYTNEGGIFLLDDRQKFEERQKIELEHTLRDLDTRLQRLEVTMSPPRCLSQLDELENSTPSLPSGKAHEPNERFLPSPTEGLAEHARTTTTSPEPYLCNCDGTLRRCNLCATQNASADPWHNTMDTEEKGEVRTRDLGRLIHTSLQHVHSTNSPPRYLANLWEPEAQCPRGEHICIPKPDAEQRDETLSVRCASPRRHLGNTAYPTPLPSSPETKSSRKRGRDDDSPKSSDRKGRREEMLRRLRIG